MTTTPILKLPYILPGQAQKHVTVNAALQRLDALVQISLKSRTESDPPADPTSGDRYLVPSYATGEWTGFEAHIAVYDDGVWMFYPPTSGWMVWVEDEARVWAFDGANWVEPPSPEQVNRLGVGAPVSGDTHFLVESNSCLFTGKKQAYGGTGDMRHVINKEATADTAGLIFQNDYTGYAEIGLIGNDDLTLRVSSDGIVFTPAVQIDKDAAHVGVGDVSPTFRFSVTQDTPLAGGVTIANWHSGANASANIVLNAANSHFFKFQLYGSGTLYAFTNASTVFGTHAPKPIFFRTDTTDRMMIHADGRISIGTYTASAKLSVEGAVRPGQYTQTTLPSASIEGSGAMIFVTDIGTNGEPAFSDGTDWRSMVTGSVV